MVRRNLTTVSDDRMRLGTGHGSEHWFELLDAAGAVKWRHAKIVDHLEDQGLRTWWANAIAAAYATERGLSNGTESLTATATRLLPASLDEAWYFTYDDAERAAWIGEDWPIKAVREGRFVRLDCGDGTEVTLRVIEADADSRVTALHAKLASDDERDAMTDFWEQALERLEEILD